MIQIDRKTYQGHSLVSLQFFCYTVFSKFFKWHTKRFELINWLTKRKEHSESTSCKVCKRRSLYCERFIKGCLPQILLGPFLLHRDIFQDQYFPHDVFSIVIVAG